MTKEKLKTLKEIDMHHSKREHIKQEAIKWVKDYREKNMAFNVRSWIINFFNITEEDLKWKKKKQVNYSQVKELKEC